MVFNASLSSAHLYLLSYICKVQRGWSVSAESCKQRAKFLVFLRVLEKAATRIKSKNYENGNNMGPLKKSIRIKIAHSDNHISPFSAHAISGTNKQTNNFWFVIPK